MTSKELEALKVLIHEALEEQCFWSAVHRWGAAPNGGAKHVIAEELKTKILIVCSNAIDFDRQERTPCETGTSSSGT